MSDFLQQLSSFLNLNKLVAVTVPGMVATIALMIFLNPQACKTDSQSCWYCMGQQKDSGSKPKGASRQLGSFLVSKQPWEQVNQTYKTVAQKVPDISACSQLPEYIVSTSRLTGEKDTVKNLGDLEPIDPATLLEELDACNAELTNAQNTLTQDDAAESNLITALNGTLATLNTALGSAKAAVNSSLERSLQAQVDATKKKLSDEMQKDSELQNRKAAIKLLSDQATKWRSSIADQVGTAVPVPTETKTTWQAAAQALGNNILMFLLVSMVVGQLLDPISGCSFPWIPSVD